MPRLFPIDLRPQTAIYKPSRRGGLVIPNRLRGGENTLLNGLVSQTDVNTSGRTDDAPYDNIKDEVATLQNAPPVIVGDGGYDGLSFLLASQQSATWAAPGIDWNAPLTIAVRCSSAVALVDNAALAFGDSVGNGLIATKITRSVANGEAEAFFQANAGGFTICTGINDLSDSVEHVIIARSLGGGTGRVQLIVDKALEDDVTSNFTGTITIDVQTWGAFLINSVYQAWGTNRIFWSAIWERLLNNDEAGVLSDSPNPFGRTP